MRDLREGLLSERARNRRRGILAGLYEQIEGIGADRQDVRLGTLLGGLIGSGIKSWMTPEDEKKAEEEAYQNEMNLVSSLDINDPDSIKNAIKFYNKQGNLTAADKLSQRLQQVQIAQSEVEANREKALTEQAERRLKEDRFKLDYMEFVSDQDQRAIDNRFKDRELALRNMEATRQEAEGGDYDWEKAYDKLPEEVRKYIDADPKFEGRGKPFSQEIVRRVSQRQIVEDVNARVAKASEVPTALLKEDWKVLNDLNPTIGRDVVGREEALAISQAANVVQELTGTSGNRDAILKALAKLSPEKRAEYVNKVKTQAYGFNIYDDGVPKTEQEADEAAKVKEQEPEVKAAVDKAINEATIPPEGDYDKDGWNDAAVAAFTAAAGTGTAIAAYRAAKVKELEALQKVPEDKRPPGRVEELKKEIEKPTQALMKMRTDLETAKEKLPVGSPARAAIDKQVTFLKDKLGDVYKPDIKGRLGDKKRKRLPDKKDKKFLKRFDRNAGPGGAKGKVIKAGIDLLTR